MQPPSSVEISKNNLGYQIRYSILDNVKKVIITGDDVNYFLNKPKMNNSIWIEQEVIIKVWVWHKGFELDFIEDLHPSFCLLSINNDTLHITHTTPWINSLRLYGITINLKMNIDDKDVENTTERGDRYTWKLRG